MTATKFPIEELRALADAACDGALSDRDAAHLEQLLRGNPEAQRYYLALVRLDGCLRWEFGNQVQAQPLPAAPTSFSDSRFVGEAVGPGVDAAVEPDVYAAVELPCQHESSGFGESFPPLPLSLHPSYPSYPSYPSLSPLPSPLSPFAVGGPVFSYMVATLILGVMLLSAWAYEITRDYGPTIAGNSRRSTTSGRTAPQRPEFVVIGRVTGMNDCRWSDPTTETYAGSAVPLGRKYALASGLMEITYRSGAKVILEGPCRYEVESAAGGYLALGKLTAKVESGEWRVERGRRSEVRGQRSEHYPLSTTHYPLFSVRTPTAVVTDLGTEFGVEVEADGISYVETFVGKVMVRGRTATEEAAGKGVVLGAGQAATISSGVQRIRARDTRNGGRFARSMTVYPTAGFPSEDLSLWLDPNRGNVVVSDDKVTWFVDRSPQRFRFFTAFVPARPGYDGSAFGTGLPGLIYEDAGEKNYRNLQLYPQSHIPDPLQLSDQFDFFAVVRVEGGQRTILSTNGENTGPGSIAWVVGHRGPGTLDFYDNNQWHGSEPHQVDTSGEAAQILETRFHRGRYEFFVGGAPAGTADGAEAMSVEMWFFIGIHGSQPRKKPFVGAMGDLIVYKRALSDEERNRVGAFLQAKYGVSGKYAPAKGNEASEHR